VHPVTRQELDAVAETWVDAALRLGDKDLKMMGRLVRSQMKRMDTGEAIDIAADALAVAS
jgi:DSF synthase